MAAAVQERTPYAMELRAEEMQVLCAGPMKRRGEVDGLAIGHEGATDIVEGEERIRVGGTLSETVQWSSSASMGGFETEVYGGLSVEGHSNTTLLAGGMSETYLNLQMIIAGMSDDMIAGAGCRVAATQVGVAGLLNDEQQLGTSINDGVIIEASRLCYERELTIGQHKAGTVTWRGNLYSTAANGLLQYWMTHNGFKNRVTAPAASEGDDPGESPSTVNPGVAEAAAVGTSMAGGAGAGAVRGTRLDPADIINSTDAADAAADAARGTDAIEETSAVNRADSLAQTQRAADSGDLGDLDGGGYESIAETRRQVEQLRAGRNGGGEDGRGYASIAEAQASADEFRSGLNGGGNVDARGYADPVEVVPPQARAPSPEPLEVEMVDGELFVVSGGGKKHTFNPDDVYAIPAPRPAADDIPVPPAWTSDSSLDLEGLPLVSSSTDTAGSPRDTRKVIVERKEFSGGAIDISDMKARKDNDHKTVNVFEMPDPHPQRPTATEVYDDGGKMGVAKIEYTHFDVTESGFRKEGLTIVDTSDFEQTGSFKSATIPPQDFEMVVLRLEGDDQFAWRLKSGAARPEGLDEFFIQSNVPATPENIRAQMADLEMQAFNKGSPVSRNNDWIAPVQKPGFVFGEIDEADDVLSADVAAQQWLEEMQFDKSLFDQRRAGFRETVDVFDFDPAMPVQGPIRQPLPPGSTMTSPTPVFASNVDSAYTTVGFDSAIRASEMPLQGPLAAPPGSTMTSPVNVPGTNVTSAYATVGEVDEVAHVFDPTMPPQGPIRQGLPPGSTMTSPTPVFASNVDSAYTTVGFDSAIRASEMPLQGPLAAPPGSTMTSPVNVPGTNVTSAYATVGEVDEVAHVDASADAMKVDEAVTIGGDSDDLYSRAADDPYGSSVPPVGSESPVRVEESLYDGSPVAGQPPPPPPLPDEMYASADDLAGVAYFPEKVPEPARYDLDRPIGKGKQISARSSPVAPGVTSMDDDAFQQFMDGRKFEILTEGDDGEIESLGVFGAGDFEFVGEYEPDDFFFEFQLRPDAVNQLDGQPPSQGVTLLVEPKPPSPPVADVPEPVPWSQELDAALQQDLGIAARKPREPDAPPLPPGHPGMQDAPPLPPGRPSMQEQLEEAATTHRGFPEERIYDELPNSGFPVASMEEPPPLPPGHPTGMQAGLDEAKSLDQIKIDQNVRRRQKQAMFDSLKVPSFGGDDGKAAGDILAFDPSDGVKSSTFSTLQPQGNATWADSPALPRSRSMSDMDPEAFYDPPPTWKAASTTAAADVDATSVGSSTGDAGSASRKKGYIGSTPPPDSPAPAPPSRVRLDADSPYASPADMVQRGAPSVMPDEVTAGSRGWLTPEGIYSDPLPRPGRGPAPEIKRPKFAEPEVQPATYSTIPPDLGATVVNIPPAEPAFDNSIMRVFGEDGGLHKTRVTDPEEIRTLASGGSIEVHVQKRGLFGKKKSQLLGTYSLDDFEFVQSVDFGTAKGPRPAYRLKDDAPRNVLYKKDIWVEIPSLHSEADDLDDIRAAIRERSMRGYNATPAPVWDAHPNALADDGSVFTQPAQLGDEWHAPQALSDMDSVPEELRLPTLDETHDYVSQSPAALDDAGAQVSSSLGTPGDPIRINGDGLTDGSSGHIQLSESASEAFNNGSEFVFDFANGDQYSRADMYLDRIFYDDGTAEYVIKVGDSGIVLESMDTNDRSWVLNFLDNGGGAEAKTYDAIAASNPLIRDEFVEGWRARVEAETARYVAANPQILDDVAGFNPSPTDAFGQVAEVDEVVASADTSADVAKVDEVATVDAPTTSEATTTSDGTTGALDPIADDGDGTVLGSMLEKQSRSMAQRDAMLDRFRDPNEVTYVTLDELPTSQRGVIDSSEPLQGEWADISAEKTLAHPDARAPSQPLEPADEDYLDSMEDWVPSKADDNYVAQQKLAEEGPWHDFGQQPKPEEWEAPYSAKDWAATPPDEQDILRQDWMKGEFLYPTTGGSPQDAFADWVAGHPNRLAGMSGAPPGMAGAPTGISDDLGRYWTPGQLYGDSVMDYVDNADDLPSWAPSNATGYVDRPDDGLLSYHSDTIREGWAAGDSSQAVSPAVVDDESFNADAWGQHETYENAVMTPDGWKPKDGLEDIDEDHDELANWLSQGSQSMDDVEVELEHPDEWTRPPGTDDGTDPLADGHADLSFGAAEDQTEDPIYQNIRRGADGIWEVNPTSVPEPEPLYENVELVMRPLDRKRQWRMRDMGGVVPTKLGEDMDTIPLNLIFLQDDPNASLAQRQKELKAAFLSGGGVKNDPDALRRLDIAMDSLEGEAAVGGFWEDASDWNTADDLITKSDPVWMVQTESGWQPADLTGAEARAQGVQVYEFHPDNRFEGGYAVVDIRGDNLNEKVIHTDPNYGDYEVTRGWQKHVNIAEEDKKPVEIFWNGRSTGIEVWERPRDEYTAGGDDILERSQWSYWDIEGEAYERLPGGEVVQLGEENQYGWWANIGTEPATFDDPGSVNPRDPWDWTPDQSEWDDPVDPVYTDGNPG